MSKKICEKIPKEIPVNPRYECKKCGGIAKKEDHLCKPVKIKQK